MNSRLPSRRHKTKYVAIHVRLGDSINRRANPEARIKIRQIINRLKIDKPGYEIHLHSDGKPVDMLEKGVYFHGKETDIMVVLSDLIYADVLICGVSSLSIFCGFINNGELVVVPDGVRNITNPPNSIKYINGKE